MPWFRFNTDGRPQPLAALYRVDPCLQRATELIEAGRRRPLDLLEASTRAGSRLRKSGISIRRKGFLLTSTRRKTIMKRSEVTHSNATPTKIR